MSRNRFNENEVEFVFQYITSSYEELQSFYSNYLIAEYADGSFDERIPCYDIARIGEFVKKQFQQSNTFNFTILFERIEDILADCDQYVNELIVIGLFESLQNAHDINYYTNFNRWLKPLSKKAWIESINFWEGKRDENKQMQ